LVVEDLVLPVRDWGMRLPICAKAEGGVESSDSEALSSAFGYNVLGAMGRRR